MVHKHTQALLVQHEEQFKSHGRAWAPSPTISHKSVRFSDQDDLHIINSFDLIGLAEFDAVQEVTDGLVLRNRASII